MELTCGDRVYYLDHQKIKKGPLRWRAGIIIKRKADYIYSTGIRQSHGYDIYDVENCTTVSRTRQDIRKYKHTKIERKLLEKAHAHLKEMRTEFLKNERFQSNNLDNPVEFELTDYDTATKNSIYPQDPEIETPAPEPTPLPQAPSIKQEPETENPGTPEIPEPPRKTRCTKNKSIQRTQ